MDVSLLCLREAVRIRQRLVRCEINRRHDDANGNELKPHAPAHQPLTRGHAPATCHVEEAESENDGNGAHRNDNNGLWQNSHSVAPGGAPFVDPLCE